MADKIIRDKPPTEGARAAAVQDHLEEIDRDRDHWKADFERIRYMRRYTRGIQWPGMTYESLKDPDRPYVANIALRQVKQRTSAIYARNPKYNFRRSKRLYHKLWDGTAETLQEAMQTIQMAQMQAIENPMAPPVDTSAAEALMQEYMDTTQAQIAIERTGETLARLYEYSLREQVHSAKTMFKRLVLGTEIDGLGYVKQTFQRVTESNPDIEREINDVKSQIDAARRIVADLEDKEIDSDDKEVDRLQAMLASLENAEQVILREGLALDFPDPTRIIPSREMTFLPEFLGCPHVTEEFFLSPNEVKEIYGIDLGHGQFTPHKAVDEKEKLFARSTNQSTDEDDKIRVLEKWSKRDGLVYVLADGFDDYLRPPAPPSPWTERFWPWFPFAPNALPFDGNSLPASSVEGIMPMQQEINRSGEALRQHRVAARPGHVTAGALNDQDAAKLQNREAHDVLGLEGIPPDKKVGDYLQAMPVNPIDPNLYNTGPAMQDMLRVSGMQEAQFGPTSGATATESAIAQSSRQSTDDSTIDEFDDLLSALARSGGQILFQEVTEETVLRVVGPGAYWPVQTRDDIARELYLEAEAGSSGRKNQAAEVNVRTQLLPFLLQIPGLSHERLAKDLLNVMDSRINYEDYLSPAMPSVVAVNGMQQAASNNAPAGADPAAQGMSGGSNAPQMDAPGQNGPNPEGTRPYIRPDMMA